MDRGRFSHEQGTARSSEAFTKRSDAGWAEYERRKAEWSRAHPEATASQYQDAMRALADECGV